jgi:molybdenum cofactor cytidylyltransferase
VSTPNKLAVAILAAGQSRRLAQPKQLLSYQGKTLIERQIALVSALRPEAVLVTVGAHRDAVKQAVALAYASQPAPTPELLLLEVTDFTEGMSASIRALAAAAKVRCFSHLMILLVDQFRVSEAHLANLISQSSAFPGRAIASNFAGLRMPPAIFPADWFDELANLRGDQGAKLLLRDRIDVIDCASDVDFGDIDVLGDLMGLL